MFFARYSNDSRATKIGDYCLQPAFQNTAPTSSSSSSASPATTAAAIVARIGVVEPIAVGVPPKTSSVAIVGEVGPTRAPTTTAAAAVHYGVVDGGHHRVGIGVVRHDDIVSKRTPRVGRVRENVAEIVVVVGGRRAASVAATPKPRLTTAHRAIESRLHERRR